MANNACACGGNAMDRFYSLFTCDHVCSSCHWTNNKCCNGCYNTNTDTCKNSCLNFYDINMVKVVQSKIYAFGYCDNHKALGIQYTDGTKKLYLNVEREVYEGLLDLNKDTLSMFLINNLSKENNQCISIP